LTPESAFEVYKKWVWQERQAKFIVNSVRVYEFWGYDWWIPLGDSDMRDFWVHVTMDSRIDKRLYVAHIQQLAMHMVGTGNRAFYGTERDTMSARIKEAAKQTPLKDAGTWLYRKLKRETEYENHPMAWYGIMPKEVFRKYYHKGYVGLNTYLAPHTIGVIDWSW
jgi:asparagine synthase (glutamine-hydrolysing)